MALFTSGREFISRFFSRRNKRLNEFKNQLHLDQRLVSSLNKSRLPSLKQLRYLPKVFSKKESRKIQLIIIAIIICLVAISYQWFLLSTSEMPLSGGEYSEALIGSPRYINPILAQTNEVDADLSSLIFSGLLKYDSQGQLIPDLAERYEISADQLIYTFYLKKNIKWHDGEPFKADDIIFTVASIQDPAFKSPLAKTFHEVTAEKIDDNSVKFSLKEPYAPFLHALTFGILPGHLWYNIPAANSDLTELNKKPIGTGPWKFDGFKKDTTGIIKSYTLVPFNDYYGDKPYLSKLVFKFYGDFISAIEAFKSKDTQGIAYLPLENRDDLKKYKNTEYYELSQPQYSAVFFNQKKNSLLADDNIRRAMALAIDKERIVQETLGGAGQTLQTIDLPGIAPASDTEQYPYDPLQAAEILEKNGWSLQTTTTADGLSEQVRKKKNQTLMVTLTTADKTQNEAAAKIIKQCWERIGIKTNIELVDKTRIIPDTINTRKYEILLFAENIGFDPDPFPFWHSSQAEFPGLNLSMFDDKKADQLLEQGRKTNDWGKRVQYYQDFEKIIAKQLPAIFLYTPYYTYVQDNSVKGFGSKIIANSYDRFRDISQWYVRTKRVWKK